MEGGAGFCWSLGGAVLIAEVGGKDLSPIEAHSNCLGTLSTHTYQDSKEKNCKPSFAFLFESVCSVYSRCHSIFEHAQRLRDTCRWTNQVSHITVIARVARDLWQHKQTLSLGFALGLGSFTAINPWPRAMTIT